MFLLEKEEQLLEQLKTKNPMAVKEAREKLLELDILEKFFSEFERIAKKESMSHEDIGDIIEIFKLLRDKRCVPYLIRVIRQSSNAFKIKAIQTLTLIPDKSALNTLFLALKLYDDEVKTEALKIINIMKSSESIEPLFTATDTRNNEMMESIIGVLKQFQANQLKEVAIKLFQDNDAEHAAKARVIMEHLFGPQKAEFIINEYLGQRSVMVCDKLPSQRNTLVKYFADSGYEVVAETGTPQEAVMLCQSKMPDVVALDLCLPTEEQGLIVIQALKKVHPEVGIILCSSSSNKAFIVKAMGLGVAKFFLKPVDKTALLSCAKDFLKERAERRTKLS